MNSADWEDDWYSKPFEWSCDVHLKFWTLPVENSFPICPLCYPNLEPYVDNRGMIYVKGYKNKDEVPPIYKKA